MSTPINDGGNAFPTLFIEPNYGTGYRGMTLRDYFAGQAMSAMIVDAESYVNEIRLAECAYMQADAMLSERKEGSK